MHWSLSPVRLFSVNLRLNPTSALCSQQEASTAAVCPEKSTRETREVQFFKNGKRQLIPIIKLTTTCHKVAHLPNSFLILRPLAEILATKLEVRCSHAERARMYESYYIFAQKALRS